MTKGTTVIERLALREMLAEPLVRDLMRRDGVTKRHVLVALCKARRGLAVPGADSTLARHVAVEGSAVEGSKKWRRLS